MRSKLILVLVGVALLVAAAASRSDTDRNADTTAVTWEYHFGKPASTSEANRLGGKRWELVVIHRDGQTETWIYKRPVR